MYCTEESTCDIVGTFGASQSFGARGIVLPLPPRRYAPGWISKMSFTNFIFDDTVRSPLRSETLPESCQ